MVSFKVAGEDGQMKEVSLMKYFYDKYGLKMEMGHLPALVIGSKKDNWVPMEVGGRGGWSAAGVAEWMSVWGWAAAV